MQFQLQPLNINSQAKNLRVRMNKRVESEPSGKRSGLFERSLFARHKGGYTTNCSRWLIMQHVLFVDCWALVAGRSLAWGTQITCPHR